MYSAKFKRMEVFVQPSHVFGSIRDPIWFQRFGFSIFLRKAPEGIYPRGMWVFLLYRDNRIRIAELIKNGPILMRKAA